MSMDSCQLVRNISHSSDFHIPKQLAASIAKLQKKWQKDLICSFHSMYQHVRGSLGPVRTFEVSKHIIASWNELSTVFKAHRGVSPVFGPKEFLNILESLNYSYKIHCSSEKHDQYSFPRLPCVLTNLLSLRNKYSHLRLSKPQIGVDDLYPHDYGFNRSRDAEWEKISNNHSGQKSKDFLKNGCPLGHRSRIWASCLNIEVSKNDNLYYASLKDEVANDDLFVDFLIHKEIQLIIENDEMYFIFCDYIYKVLLPFLRDRKVLEIFNDNPHAVTRHSRKECSDGAIYPPSGVIPFRGFSMYVAPLCYLYDDTVQLYFTFRCLYMRFFHRLHLISDDPEGIVLLCVLFDHILQEKEPELYLHLRAVGAPPLRLAFKWILRAFSGYMSPEQVLLLWDRILAWDSLQIIPVLAAAILSFRKRNLMEAKNLPTIESVLADFSTLNVTLLLQIFLFTHPFDLE